MILTPEAFTPGATSASKALSRALGKTAAHGAASAFGALAMTALWKRMTRRWSKSVAI